MGTTREDDYVLDTTLPARTSADQKPTTRDEFLGLLGKAIEQQVHDVFIEPGDNSGEVSFRTDGRLSTHRQITKARAEQYINLLADAARLPPHRLRQQLATGEILIRHRGKAREARVSFIETLFGITADLRLSTKTPPTLDELGFESEQLQAIKQTLATRQGLVVIAGPTASGTSETGEAILRHVESARKLKVFEIADVFEYKNPTRSQILTGKEITWKSALGAALDFRADVIYAGDIRTSEQAKAVAEASLRCPLVVCTLHAKTAAQAINRLQRMGVEDYQLSAALIIVIAQELRRQLCQKCKTAEEGRHFTARGCEACSGTGYSGLTLVGEVLPVTPQISTQLERHAGGERVMKHAVSKDGVLTMREVEKRKATAGLIELRPEVAPDEADGASPWPGA